MKKMLKNAKGFTLVELLAVIVILGIIAAIAVPSIGNIIQTSREDAVIADAEQVLNAAEIYGASHKVSTGVLDVDSSTISDSSTPELADYVDLTNATAWTTKPTVSVTVTGGDITYKVSGQATAGSKKIKFTNATMSELTNASDSNSYTAGSSIAIVTP